MPRISYKCTCGYEKKKFFSTALKITNNIKCEECGEEMPFHLNLYLMGFVSRFQVLKEECKDGNSTLVKSARKLLEKRRGLVHHTVSLLAEDEN